MRVAALHRISKQGFSGGGAGAAPEVETPSSAASHSPRRHRIRMASSLTSVDPTMPASDEPRLSAAETAIYRDEVLTFNRLFKAMRPDAQRAVRAGGDLLNIAFSRTPSQTLTSSAEAAKFRDEAFQAGLPARSLLAWRPDRASRSRFTEQLKFGRPGAIPDVVLTVASDDVNALQEEVDHLKATLKMIPARRRPAGVA